MKLRLRHDVAALALDRLDEHAGHFVRRDAMDEHLVLEKSGTRAWHDSGLQSDRAAISAGSRVVNVPAASDEKPRRWMALLEVSDSDP